MTTDQITPPKPRRSTAAKPSRPPQGVSRQLRLVTASGDDTGSQAKPKTTRAGKVGQVKGGASILTGLTDKQEAFAQAVASGKNQSEAYRLAYDAGRMAPNTVWGEACRLLSHPQVAARLMVLNQEKENQRRMMAVSRAERVLQRLETLADSATTESVKVRANELLGKTAGLFTDQVEITDTTDRSVADIQQSITDRLRRLGLAG